MENNYNDFCLCSPETYTLIAKKYKEQISQRSKNEKNQNVNAFYILALLQQNIEFLEGMTVATQSYIPLIQKIYVKTYNLLSMAKKEFSIENDVKIHKKENYQKKIHPAEIKKNSIYNLCQVAKNLINSDTKIVIHTLELIEFWSEV